MFVIFPEPSLHPTSPAKTHGWLSRDLWVSDMGRSGASWKMRVSRAAPAARPVPLAPLGQTQFSGKATDFSGQTKSTSHSKSQSKSKSIASPLILHRIYWRSSGSQTLGPPNKAGASGAVKTRHSSARGSFRSFHPELRWLLGLHAQGV